jgi:LexA-binding, inner membrane-associated putative hydrolase
MNMYLFDHLLVCTLIGLCASYVIKDLTRTETVLSFALGGIISDLIDKPLYGFDGFGRSIAHSIVIVTVVFLICWYLFRKDNKIRTLSLIFYIGIFIHHIMDQMWLCYQVWFFPLFGNPTEFCEPEWPTLEYLYLLTTNINAQEIVFATISIVLLAEVIRDGRSDPLR